MSKQKTRASKKYQKNRMKKPEKIRSSLPNYADYCEDDAITFVHNTLEELDLGVFKEEEMEITPCDDGSIREYSLAELEELGYIKYDGNRWVGINGKSFNLSRPPPAGKLKIRPKYDFDFEEAPKCEFPVEIGKFLV